MKILLSRILVTIVWSLLFVLMGVLWEKVQRRNIERSKRFWILFVITLTTNLVFVVGSTVYFETWENLQVRVLTSVSLLMSCVVMMLNYEVRPSKPNKEEVDEDGDGGNKILEIRLNLTRYEDR